MDLDTKFFRTRKSWNFPKVGNSPGNWCFSNKKAFTMWDSWDGALSVCPVQPPNPRLLRGLKSLGANAQSYVLTPPGKIFAYSLCIPYIIQYPISLLKLLYAIIWRTAGKGKSLV